MIHSPRIHRHHTLTDTDRHRPTHRPAGAAAPLVHTHPLFLNCYSTHRHTHALAHTQRAATVVRSVQAVQPSNKGSRAFLLQSLTYLQPPPQPTPNQAHTPAPPNPSPAQSKLTHLAAQELCCRPPHTQPQPPRLAAHKCQTRRCRAVWQSSQHNTGAAGRNRPQVAAAASPSVGVGGGAAHMARSHNPRGAGWSQTKGGTGGAPTGCVVRGCGTDASLQK